MLAGLLAGRFTSGGSLSVFVVGVWYAISPRARRMLSAARPSISVQGLRLTSVLALVSAGGIAYLDAGMPTASVAARSPGASPRSTHDGPDAGVKPGALQPESTTLTPPTAPGAVAIPSAPRILPPRRSLLTFDDIQEKLALERAGDQPSPKPSSHTPTLTPDAHNVKMWLLAILSLTLVYTMGTIVIVATGGSRVLDDGGKVTHEHRCTHCHQPIDTADVPGDGKPFDCPRCGLLTKGQWVTLE
jgi:hypothetical protein